MNTGTLQAESLSIFLDKSGRGKWSLPAGSAFRVEHALKTQRYTGVSHAWLVTAKPENQNKQQGYFRRTLAHDNQGIISFETKLVQVFKIPVSVFTEKN